MTLTPVNNYTKTLEITQVYLRIIHTQYHSVCSNEVRPMCLSYSV
jgi:hypothetical protein